MRCCTLIACCTRLKSAVPTCPDHRPKQCATTTRVALGRTPPPSQNPALSPPPSPFLPPSLQFLSPFAIRIAPSYQCKLTEPVSAASLSEEFSATKLFPSGSGPFSTGVLSRGPVDLFFSCIATSPRIFFLLIRSLLQSSRGTGLNWPSVLIFTWTPNRGITLLSFFLLSFCPINLHYVSAPYCFRSSAL